MSKKILGLDLGTNSIGWALVDKENKKILGMGSRIIPMGSDKIDYEKGAGITKNADRRTKRTIRKMNKRFKLRRNKLLFILHELGMLPKQFQFKEGIPRPNKIQDLELLPIKKGTMQLDSLGHYELRANSIEKPVDNLKNFGKILYQFNQLRGYSGGNNDEDAKKKKEDDIDEETEKKKYEVITQKVTILKVEKSNRTFKVKGGKNKGEEQFYYDVTISFENEEMEGSTMLQNLKEKEGQEEELEIRIKRTKKEENVTFALPQKTNWRKQMEATEEILKNENLFVSQLLVKDLKQNKWTRIRNRVVLRHRYQAEFDTIWKTQSAKYPILNNCPKETIEKIAKYLFPGKSESQEKLRKAAIQGGLKYIIKDQVIYYQRPLKPQTELISNCQFEKEEKVMANSHPLFQEFRCWDQINRMYITSKQEIYSERKKKNIFQYTDRFLTNDEKQEIYNKLQNQKQLGFGEVAKIVKLKNDKTEYLNGLNVKAKLKGCDTTISIKKILGEHFETLFEKDNDIIAKIWQAIFDNANNGSEYDPKSLKVSSISEVLKPLNNDTIATELALKLVQNIKFPRKYASLSKKAIENILSLMQLKPDVVPEKVKNNFENVQYLIETGEILNENLLEDYVISFVKNNSDALQTGGLMYAFASSLVYGKHTKETIKAQIKNYHEIKYENRNLRNPVVEQVANETMQVIKAIWKQYKLNPEELEIKVELARDLKNSAAEREKIYKRQIRNNKINETIKKRLEEEKMPVTNENILKYKLYEQQKFVSPYSGDIMEVSLFAKYEIDHVIPKSRYFDDSFSNKVLVEGFLNEEKSNKTAWEYITQQNSQYKIQSEKLYLKHINENFFGRKKKNLTLEKIPTNPVERQIKDTQYISVAVKNELAKIVGSDKVKTSTGEVTSFLRSRWGLKRLFMELTESRFKQMELWDWNKETNQPNTEWVQKYFDKEREKHIYEIKNWSKRYDHRHHSIDALVVALTEQKHIQRLNNLNKYLQDELTKRKDEFKIEVREDENIIEAFFNLESSRRTEIQKQIESSRHFEKPFEDLIKQAEKLLETMVVSIKPKDKLGIKVDEKTGKKQLKIRAALHQETYYGKLNGKDTKTVAISKLTTKDISKVIDEVIKKEIDVHRKKYESTKEAFTGEGLKAFNESRFQRKNPTELKAPVYKVKVWYSAKEDKDSSLQKLYDNNNKLSVVTGDNYLFSVLEKENKNGKERLFDIASLYDSVTLANTALKENNVDFKRKIATERIDIIRQELKKDIWNTQKELGDKFSKAKGKKKEELQDKIEAIDENFHLKLLFTLQQNDLVYLPENVDDPVLKFNNDDFQEWLKKVENKKKFTQRTYKVVMFTGKDAKFISHNYANTISVPKVC
ncbi:MAG TPA: type II CRISPR RNA-guided endonuclease Cas9 [Bacteroidia bacterium]|jgi:CRISPR-associated endonuclease Csn1|nr:type II CRISPR RNA-guided endonuclease Cas9 [Bacteroidia bacterium]